MKKESLETYKTTESNFDLDSDTIATVLLFPFRCILQNTSNSLRACFDGLIIFDG